MTGVGVGQQDAGAVGVQVWSQDPVRMVLPAAQWAGVLAGRPGVDVPARFAVGPPDVTPVPDTELARSRVRAAHRMLDVVGAAAVRVHVGSWGRGRATAAMVCLDGDRAVSLASAGPEQGRGVGAAGAPSWVEVSAVWGRDAAAEVLRAGHPGLDTGSSRPGPLEGPAAVSPAWAAAIRDGDPEALRALLSAGAGEEVPDQVRALVGGPTGGTAIRVQVRATGGGPPAAGWSGAWLATPDGTLAVRTAGSGADPVRLWWTAPGEVSRDLRAALTGR